jgi:hypothetical protein
MPAGPGKYDDLCTLVREQAEAPAALIIIIGGNRGTGFSCQTTLPPPDIAKLLEEVAATIRRDG